jgi:hypothetical protein
MRLFLLLLAATCASAAFAQDSTVKLSRSGLAIEQPGFELRMRTWAQFRFTYQDEHANGSDGSNGRDFANFRVRNAKTTFSGHAVATEFQYRLTLNWVAGGDAILERAWFKWAIDPAFNLGAGQDKVDWNWEYSTSATRQQFVERGYVNAVFNHSYAKGIFADGKFDLSGPVLKYFAGVYNGVLRADSDFRNRDVAIISDSFADGRVDNDMMLNARVELHPFGELARNMNDPRSQDRFDKLLLAFGAAANYFYGGFNRPALRGDTAAGTPASGRSRTSHDTLALTADANLRWYGFSLFAAVYWRHTEFHNRGSNRFKPTEPARSGISNLTDFGATVEAAYFVIPSRLSVGARWNHLDADEFWGNGTDRRQRSIRPDANEVGASVNWLIHGDNLRLTADVLYVAQQLTFGESAAATTLRGVYNTPPVRRGTLGESPSSADYNNLWIMRVQLQWIF